MSGPRLNKLIEEACFERLPLKGGKKKRTSVKSAFQSHNTLAAIVAAWKADTGGLMGQATILELMAWSTLRTFGGIPAPDSAVGDGLAGDVPLQTPSSLANKEKPEFSGGN